MTGYSDVSKSLWICQYAWNKLCKFSFVEVDLAVRYIVTRTNTSSNIGNVFLPGVVLGKRNTKIVVLDFWLYSYKGAYRWVVHVACKTYWDGNCLLPNKVFCLVFTLFLSGAAPDHWTSA